MTTPRMGSGAFLLLILSCGLKPGLEERHEEVSYNAAIAFYGTTLRVKCADRIHLLTDPAE